MTAVNSPQPQINRMLKILFFCVIIMFTCSCNPQMHVVGFGMRKYNTSLNKYSKHKPYIKYKK